MLSTNTSAVHIKFYLRTVFFLTCFLVFPVYCHSGCLIAGLDITVGV